LGEVELVVEDRGAGDGFQPGGASDVVNVRVGDDDLFDGEVMPGEDGEDAVNFVAGVDHDGFVGGFVAQNGTVALQQADAENFVDHDYDDTASGMCIEATGI